MAGQVRRESGEPIEWIWIAHEEKRNAITLDMWEELARVLDAVETSGTRALVLTGAGERAFAAGADISEFTKTKADPAAARRSFDAVDSVCRRLRALPIPVVAAINGHAIGAGLELAAAADFRIAARDSRLGITAARLGITVGLGHIRRLVDVIGPARAQDLLMTGRLLSADEALAWGLVTQVAPDADGARQAAQELAQLLATRAPLSLAWAKRGVARVVGDPALESVADDAGESIQCFDTEDFREAVSAFLEKRTPRFHGC